MTLIKTICKIQYQVAKLEIIEFLFQHEKNTKPSLESEIACNMITTLRQKLFDDSETCLDLFLFETSANTIKPSIQSLQNTIASVNNFILRMNSGLTTPDTLLLKELFTNIITALLSLNTVLETQLLELSELSLNLDSLEYDVELKLSALNINSPSYTEQENDHILIHSEALLKKLISKCMGDREQAERLIRYEYQKNSKMSREDAVQSAITRWELDNR